MINNENKLELQEMLNGIYNGDVVKIVNLVEKAISEFSQDFDINEEYNLKIIKVKQLNEMKNDCISIFKKIDKKAFRDKRSMFCGNIVLDLENGFISNYLTSNMFHEISANIYDSNCTCNYNYKKENIRFDSNGDCFEGSDICPKTYSWINKGICFYLYQNSDWIQNGKRITEMKKCNFKLYVYIIGL